MGLDTGNGKTQKQGSASALGTGESEVGAFLNSDIHL